MSRTSIYIADNSIQTVSGADNGKVLTVDNCCRRDLEADVVKNGDIKDEEKLKDCLSNFFKANNLNLKKVTLVLDCNQIMYRDMAVPVVNDKKLRTLVENEFAVREAGYGELIYDYTVLQPKLPGGGGRILACAVEKTLIIQYVSLFEHLGIKLEGIDIGLACAIRVCRRTQELKNKTYIWAILDGKDMISILFHNGLYRFSNRSSLYEARGTQAATMEISRNISSLIQFHGAQKIEDPLSDVFLGGLEGDEMELCSNLDMAALLNMDIHTLPNSFPIKYKSAKTAPDSYFDCLYCFGDLLKDK